MKIRGPVDKSIQPWRNFICNWKDRSTDKHLARRRWRRSLKRIAYKFEQDEEIWYDEIFNTPNLSSWDVW